MRYLYKLRKVCIKSNGHSVHKCLNNLLPQVTTNLELTPKLCGQELRLPDPDQNLDPDPEQNGVAV